MENWGLHHRLLSASVLPEEAALGLLKALCRKCRCENVVVVFLGEFKQMSIREVPFPPVRYGGFQAVAAPYVVTPGTRRRFEFL